VTTFPSLFNTGQRDRVCTCYPVCIGEESAALFSTIYIYDDDDEEHDAGETSGNPVRCESRQNYSFAVDNKKTSVPAKKRVAVEDHSWNWHKRFGHLNYVSLKMLQDKEMVVGLPRLDNFGDVCKSCATGKSHREAFDKTEVWRASQPLELVHSDVCDPMQVTTGGGNRYFLTLIDDYTRM